MSEENTMNGEPRPCSAPEFAQFDFWLGEWDLTWGDEGRGTNSITKILDGCVVREQFDGRPSIEFQGISLSTYDIRTAKWRQTWVDNSGGYLDFTGEFTDGKMVLSRQALVDGKPVKQRMVWYNIHSNELDWDWQRSDDDGETWQTLWQIHYRRK